MQSLMPEFFMILGIDFFLATSVLTCIFDKHFPDKLAYLYQLLGLAGFGQLLVTREFMVFFAEYMRFWYSFIYLAFAVANIAILNVYLFFYRKKRTIAKLFSVIATAPTTILATLFVYNYAAEASHPIVAFPQLPLDLVFICVYAFDTLIVAAGIYALAKPRWWKVAVPSVAVLLGGGIFTLVRPTLGEPAFVAGMMYIYISLGTACLVVLGASIVVLLRFFLENFRRR